MPDLELESLDEIVVHYQKLEDPRSTVNQLHPLTRVVVNALLAVVAGAGKPTAIARWEALKQELLAHLLDLPNGVPRKDVFRRVLMVLTPAAFPPCFAGWLQSLCVEATARTGVERLVLPVEGKTLRRSHDRRKGLGALHLVIASASEYGLSLGQMACDEKSNEITAIAITLKRVDVAGAILTIDAMGTHKASAGQIDSGKADDVLALKQNSHR